MKTKYATKAAEAFKKIEKCKQSSRVCVDKSTELLELSKACLRNGGLIYITPLSKMSNFAEKQIHSLKKIV